MKWTWHSHIRQVTIFKHCFLMLETCFLFVAIIRPFLVFFQFPGATAIWSQELILRHRRGQIWEGLVGTRYNAKPQDSPASRIGLCVGEEILIDSRKTVYKWGGKTLGAQRQLGRNLLFSGRILACGWGNTATVGSFLCPANRYIVFIMSLRMNTLLGWRGACRQKVV